MQIIHLALHQNNRSVHLLQNPPPDTKILSYESVSEDVTEVFHIPKFFL